MSKRLPTPDILAVGGSARSSSQSSSWSPLLEIVVPARDDLVRQLFVLSGTPASISHAGRGPSSLSPFPVHLQQTTYARRMLPGATLAQAGWYLVQARARQSLRPREASDQPAVLDVGYLAAVLIGIDWDLLVTTGAPSRTCVAELCVAVLLSWRVVATLAVLMVLSGLFCAPDSGRVHGRSAACAHCLFLRFM